MSGGHGAYPEAYLARTSRPPDVHLTSTRCPPGTAGMRTFADECRLLRTFSDLFRCHSRRRKPSPLPDSRRPFDLFHETQERYAYKPISSASQRKRTNREQWV